MKVLFYSSPYLYYAENLIPVARLFQKYGHKVYASANTNLKDLNQETDILSNQAVTYSKDFLSGNLESDIVILTQPWWYRDQEIAAKCVKSKIPFYIIDHAPPMISYSEANGKSSHLYRANLNGARAFFAYGEETKKIMRAKGCKEHIVPIGSPRIHYYLRNIVQDNNESKNILLFDTSHRMEDLKILKIYEKLKKELTDYNILIREHSRSTHKFSNKNLSLDPEYIAVAKSDICIFTFPSSAMLLPALLNKKIISLYSNHFSKDAREYAVKYRNEFLNYPDMSFKEILSKQANYSLFIQENLSNIHKSPAEEIMKYILKDIGE